MTGPLSLRERPLTWCPRVRAGVPRNVGLAGPRPRLPSPPTPLPKGEGRFSKHVLNSRGPGDNWADRKVARLCHFQGNLPSTSEHTEGETMFRPNIQKAIERIFKSCATATCGVTVGLGLLGCGAPGGRPARAEEAQHPLYHGRRRGLVQHRRLSPRHHVRQDAQPRQAGQRRHDVHRLLRRGQLHGGPGELHHRRNPPPHRADHRRPGRRRRGPAGTGLHAGHRAEGAGLCHRAVRQEPPGRHEQVPADRARLRRILRLPVPPRRDVRSVLVRLSPGLDRQDRPAQPGALLGDRHGRPHRAAALGQDRQAEDRRRRPVGAVSRT